MRSENERQVPLDFDVLNTYLLGALGIADQGSLIDVTLEIRPQSIPVVTIRRMVTNAGGMVSLNALIGIETTIANVSLINHPAH